MFIMFGLFYGQNRIQNLDFPPYFPPSNRAEIDLILGRFLAFLASFLACPMPLPSPESARLKSPRIWIDNKDGNHYNSEFYNKLIQLVFFPLDRLSLAHSGCKLV